MQYIIIVQDSQLEAAYNFGCIPRPGGRYCVDSLSIRFYIIDEVKQLLPIYLVLHNKNNRPSINASESSLMEFAAFNIHK